MKKSNCSPYHVAAWKLREKNIPALLLRDDPNNLPELDEVDILVPPDRLELASKILKTLDWELLDSGIFHPHKRALVTYVDSRLLKIDLHGEPIDKAIIYDDYKSYFDKSSSHDCNFLVPSNDTWLKHVILHIILGKTALPEKYYIEIKKRTGITPIKEIDHQSNKIKEILHEVLADPIAILSNPEILKNLKKRLTWALIFNNGNFLRGILHKIIWIIGQPFGFRMGVLISVIGPDGAGKTTFISTLLRKFAALQIPARSFYFGPWEQPYLSTSKFLTRLGVSPLDEHIDHAWKTMRISKILKAYIKLSLYYLNFPFEFIARYLRYALPHLLLRRVVITDRYAYDIEVGYGNIGISRMQYLRTLFVNFLPTPNFSIFLDNEAEVIWRRKQEYPFDVIVDALSRYRNIANARKMITINTEASPEELVEIFLKTNWRKITRLRCDRYKLPFVSRGR